MPNSDSTPIPHYIATQRMTTIQARIPEDLAKLANDKEQISLDNIVSISTAFFHQ